MISLESPRLGAPSPCGAAGLGWKTRRAPVPAIPRVAGTAWIGADRRGLWALTWALIPSFDAFAGR